MGRSFVLSGGDASGAVTARRSAGCGLRGASTSRYRNHPGATVIVARAVTVTVDQGGSPRGSPFCWPSLLCSKAAGVPSAANPGRLGDWPDQMAVRGTAGPPDKVAR